jgi:hypothetical protein
MKKTLKSIGAIVAGFITVVILSTVTDLILESTGIFPSAADQMKYGPDRWLLITALIYRSVYTVLGGFITAKLAPSNPMKHVKILAVIGFIAGLIGVIVGWNLSEQWYPIALAMTGPLFVWWGGKLAIKKNSKVEEN